VDDIERGNAVKKLSIQRKPKGAKPSLLAAAPRGVTGGVGGVRAEWTSTDSLSSSNSDDKQSPVFFGARAQLAPGEARQPLLPPPPSPRFAPRRNPQVEKTLMETRLRLEQERLLLAQPHGEPPPPRRRFASFGGGSSSSLSSYSGSHHPLPANGHLPNGEYNPYYPPSVGSSIRHSPLSSGMATPVTNVSPLHLQQIREQMVVALKKLKELEEQVKTIPILQVKIAVLQEEKRQLAAQSKNLIPGGGFRKRSFSVGSADQMENPGNPVQKETELHIMEPDAQEQSAQRLEEFRRLAAGVQALETTMAAAETRPRELAQNRPHQRSVGVVTEENMSSLLPVKRAPTLRDAGVSTERRETRSAAVGVTEAMLGVTGEAEREIELQQQTIEALKETIYRLEVQMKEATHQIEMGKLKLELQAAGGSTRKKVDKGSTARPEVYSVGVAAKVQTRSLGVGERPDCGRAAAPETLSVGAGPEVPMDRWVVRERVDVHDRCVGRWVETRDQPAATERSALREVAVNTEESVPSRALCRPMAELSKESRSVGCGDGPVEEVVKATLSRGTGPDYVGRADAGVTAAPESATTETNTETPVLTDSFTDTEVTTCERHTNTAATETRTVAAGDGLVKDVHATVNTRSVAVGTATDAESFGGKSSCARTKECGVGPASVQENFLVGLKTRNMACGPSQPEECGAVEIAAPLQAQAQAGGASGTGLDHYIERVQQLLQEQQMLLAENYSELAEAFGQPQSQFGSINSQLVSTLSSINSVMKHGSAEDVRMPDGVNEREGERLEEFYYFSFCFFLFHRLLHNKLHYLRRYL